MKKELGGQRLGNGKKMEVAMRNYERSSHDLSRVWRSSMAPGVLTPCFSEVALNGDTWKINLRSLVRTLPTTGPLFGSFKFQVDVFSCPIRLYQGLLHNNAVSIGLKMNQVKLPIASIPFTTDANSKNVNRSCINTSSLWHFLGYKTNYYSGTQTYENINALKLLMYYDIFKNYYSNKQETNFKLISGGEVITAFPESVSIFYQKQSALDSSRGNTNSTPTITQRRGYSTKPVGQVLKPIVSKAQIWGNNPIDAQSTVEALNIDSDDIMSIIKGNASVIIHSVDGNKQYANCVTMVLPATICAQLTRSKLQSLCVFRTKKGTDIPIHNVPLIDFIVVAGDDAIKSTLYPKDGYRYVKLFYGAPDYQPGDVVEAELELKAASEWTFKSANNEPKIIDVPLENIDKARREILKKCELGDQVLIGNTTTATINFEPYLTNVSIESTSNLSKNEYPLNGLVLKTFNSDLFNNWLNSELISGSGGVSELSAVDITADKLSLDALNLKQKIYNMLNRIVASGNTYEDWQEAIWGEEAIRRAESPIYQGGMSGEIVFEEVVSSSESETEATGSQPIGTLAGKGTLSNAHGGEIEIDVKEPSIIMAIASITPRVDYCQGVSWDLTELKTLDDLHKPELDGIGFQNLPVKWMFGNTPTNSVIGKQPAWIQYMTAVNEVHGDFADEGAAAFMTLQKRYEWNDNGTKINGLSTYIDPVMFNTAFAVESLSAQNFWVQIGFDALARRKMSAKIIPNL